MGIVLTLHGTIECVFATKEQVQQLEEVVKKYLYDSPNYHIEEQEGGICFNTSVKNDWRPFVDELRKHKLYGNLEFFALIPDISGTVIFNNLLIKYIAVEQDEPSEDQW